MFGFPNQSRPTAGAHTGTWHWRLAAARNAVRGVFGRTVRNHRKVTPKRYLAMVTDDATRDEDMRAGRAA